MIRAGAIVLVVLVAAVMIWQLRVTRAELAAAEARIAGYEEAARWRERENRRAAGEAVLDETLRTGAGADAPLSDYLRDGAGRVWP